jgi:hypothetical protein
MPARRVRCLIASAAAVAACALLPAAASAHPEACAETTFSTSLISPFEDVNAASEGCMSDAAISGIDDSAAQLAAGESAGTSNLRLLSNTPKAAPFESTADLNSDIAFEDGYAFQGNYDGIQVWDVRKGDSPKLVGALHCPGSQNDVTVNDGIMVTSTDSRRNKAECEGNRPATGAESGSEATSWEGVRVFDVSDPANPRYLTAVRTDCGSHTHTVLPEDDRLLIYVSSYDSGAGRVNCEGAHDKISIVEVPLDDPASAAVLSEPNLFPNGGNPGDADTRATNGCHDITVYQAIDLAAGACTGQGSIIDISNPVSPKVIANVEDPNFAFWHSATISQDGKKVLFTDEKGGGSGAECNPTVGPNRGADAIYDITDPANPRFLSYFKIPRTQTNEENCVAHNGNALPVKGRDILIQSWYQGGISVVDWTDGRNPKELGWFDRGPIDETRRVLGGFWSSYYYNGHVFGSEIQRGWDVFEYTEDGEAANVRTGTLNAQTQFPLR